jgi:hypothetical protein
LPKTWLTQGNSVKHVKYNELFDACCKISKVLIIYLCTSTNLSTNCGIVFVLYRMDGKRNIDLLMCWLFYIAQFFSCGGYRWEDKYFAAYRKHFGLLNLHQIDEDEDFMDADKVGFESNAFVQWIIFVWLCFPDAGLWWDCEIVRSRKICDTDCQFCW